MRVRIEPIAGLFSVCRIRDDGCVDWTRPFTFLSRTDEELSLVCPTESVPAETEAREDGWRAFRVQGTLDFSLTGILAGIAAVLAEEKISIFAVSTYNTDYVLVREKDFAFALKALGAKGYEAIEAVFYEGHKGVL